MQILECFDDTARYEASGALVEELTLLQHGPDVTAETGLHQEVEILLVTVGFIQAGVEIKVGGWKKDTFKIKLFRLSCSRREVCCCITVE